MYFDETYKNQLNTAWKKYINNEDFDYSFMRPEILESWKRSRNFLVNPYRTKTTILHSEDLQQRQAVNSLLIETVRPYMENLYSIVKGSGYYLMLCDRDGYILHIQGDPDIIEQGKNTLLVVGANRSEAFAGTNAIGTCLTLRKPIQIWHGEHYIQGHQAYTCSGAPIFDENQQLLGCLNLTGRYTEAHTHTLGMVMSAVDGISKEMKIRKAYEEIAFVSAQRTSILESVRSGFILLNKADKIIEINKGALEMLNIKYENAINKSIFELISLNCTEKSNYSFAEQDIEFFDREVNVYHVGFSIPPVKFNMSINFVDDSKGTRIGTLVRLNEIDQIHKLVNKISGYKSSFTFDSIIASDPDMLSLIKNCKRIAKTDSNILILGESGTGKEMIAQAIHNDSNYSDGPFVAINCGALPNGLIESELFGYERGAFTGANKEGNPGKFELADGGTIFLDEIGDMPLNVQVTLLRVLQSREIIRIGGKHPKKINVRIIAATNRNLHEAIESKAFREDLYYRLNVFSIQVPPLRERGDDVIHLADYIVKKFNKLNGSAIELSPSVYDVLRKYSWPGNVRELENTIERAVNITDDEEIRIEHITGRIRNLAEIIGTQNIVGADNNGEVKTVAFKNDLTSGNTLSLESAEFKLILSSLEKTDGNIKEAAALLGISRRTLYRKLDKHNIRFDNHRLKTTSNETRS